MKNKRVAMITALMLYTALLSITSVDAEAKTKAYKAKNVTVTSGKSKIVKTKKKIKKVKIVSKNKNFTVKKTDSKKFKVSGTDAGKTQTVKVTYTNKYTQKFKIKTKAASTKKPTVMPSYAKKIVDELKPLLVDPDKGLQTVLAQWEKKLGYECDFKLINTPITGNTTYLTLDEITKNYTTSQKKALVLEVYFRTRMTYSSADDYYRNRNSNTYFKKLYNGTFKGVCEDGTAMAYDICQYLGVKANYAGSDDLNHSWCGIWVTDKNGTSYWHGIYTTSYGYNLKPSVPQNNRKLTRKQVESYKCNPCKTLFHATKKQIVKTPTRTPKPATTTAPPAKTTPVPVSTQTPAATTEPTKAPVVTQTPATTQAPTTQPTVEPVVTQAPTQAPVVTPEPTVEPTPVPTETPAPTPQRILIPYAEHGYTCAGCNPLNPPPIRHTDNNNPYITNSKTTYKDYVVYKHVIGTEMRWFDADGNEYIDINGDGNIMNELIQLAG